MHDRNLDISCIRKTHVDANETIELNGYVIQFSGSRNAITSDNNAKNNPKGGVAIAIRKSFTENIYQINRINNRIIEIRMKTGDAKKISQYSVLMLLICNTILVKKLNTGVT